MLYLIINDACINSNWAQEVCTFGINSQVWKSLKIVYLNLLKNFLFHIGRQYTFYFIFFVYVVMALTFVYTLVMYFRVYFGFNRKNTERRMEKSDLLTFHICFVWFFFYSVEFIVPFKNFWHMYISRYISWLYWKSRYNNASYFSPNILYLKSKNPVI